MAVSIKLCFDEQRSRSNSGAQSTTWRKHYWRFFLLLHLLKNQILYSDGQICLLLHLGSAVRDQRGHLPSRGSITHGKRRTSRTRQTKSQSWMIQLLKITRIISGHDPTRRMIQCRSVTHPKPHFRLRPPPKELQVLDSLSNLLLQMNTKN